MKSLILSKRSFILILAALVLPIISLQAQGEDKITTKWSGFVKNDFFFDSRQTISAREGQFLLFPSAVSPDPDGEDLNAAPSFNFLALQSRLTFDVSGPERLGAALSAKIEGDFFAQANDNINLFRLRHAYIKMRWPKTELLAGQFWIPMFIPGCFPGTVSFNTGTPIQPFGRSPQIRLTQYRGDFAWVGILSSQRDFASRGPEGVTSAYLRNSVLPEASLQLHLQREKLYAGLGGSMKKIIPQLRTGSGYRTNEGLLSFNAIAFLKLTTPLLVVKAEGVYGQNIPDVLSIGGFGVSDSLDPVKGLVAYSPLSTLSAWIDVESRGANWKFGLFAGHTSNLGAADEIIGPVYGLATNIRSLYRISPRMVYDVSPLRLALELEYTEAAYGAGLDKKARPEDLTSAANLRVLLAMYYFF